MSIAIERLPHELTQRTQWCRWKPLNGTKCPLAYDGTRFSSTDSTTWAGFDQVKQFDEIGFVFSAEDPYCGVDLDGCLVDGQLTEWAAEILEHFQGVAYCEVSPSGQGVKLITRGTKLEGSRCKHSFDDQAHTGVECYDQARFWTMTGQVYGGFETIGDGQAGIDWLCKMYLGSKPLSEYLPDPQQVTSCSEDRDSILKRASAYLAKMEPAISGQGGHTALLMAARAMRVGFALDTATAYRLLADEYNPRCQPPWDEKEIRRKISEAEKCGKQTGYLLDANPAQNNESRDKTSTTSGKSEVLSQDKESKNQKLSIPELAEFQPFPTRELPEPLADFIEQAASAICCDESFVALPLLTALGAAIGNSYSLLVKRRWTVPPIIWSVVLAESGSNKSAPLRAALSPVRSRQERLLEQFDRAYAEWERENDIFEKELSSWKKTKDSIDPPPEAPEEPVCKRVIVQDTTIEGLAKRLCDNPRGLLCANDELSGWFASFNRYSKNGTSADEAKWLEFFNAQPSIIDRAGSKRPVYIRRAAVSVCGTIQPEILRKNLTSEYRASGLAARLLFAMPPRRTKQWTEDEIEESVEDKIHEIFDSLFDLEMGVDETGNHETNLIRLDHQAKRLFVSHFNRHNREQAALAGDLYSAYSKLEEYVARFALIVHCVRHATGEIKELATLDQNSMSTAIILVDWFKREAERVYSLLSESQQSAVNRQIIQWIAAQPGPVRPRDLHRAHKTVFETTDKAEIFLRALADADIGTITTTQPGPEGGRPTLEFNLKAGDKTSQNPGNAEVLSQMDVFSEEIKPVIGEPWKP